MSAHDTSSSLVPPGGSIESAQADDATATMTSADLADLLANGQWDNPASGGHDIHAGATEGYDGHVALALDPGLLPDIDSTLDMLTSSHHLFDVPALDVSSVADDASST